MTTKTNAEICPRFFCEKCEYKTNKKSSFDAHLLSFKHNLTTPLLPTCKKYSCTVCSKSFIDRAGLWRHGKKKCFPEAITSSNELKTDTKHLTELVMKLIDQNQELSKQLIELSKNSNTTNNITNTNSNNNFNLNLYLNDTCKDAINISDFVDSLVLSINDLEETARIGYANGISKIFINGLQKMDVCKRPLHCSDVKRNTLYIKNENQWIKETEEKPILTKAIKQVANKNIKNIFEWQKNNPDYNDPDSKQNDQYNQIICETMSGSCKEEQTQNYEKIVKNISKQVIIEKE
jgi:hypothetical protein